MNRVTGAFCVSLLLLGPVCAQGRGPNLERGDRGDAVRTLQHVLNDARREAALSKISMDGAYGPRTERAVRELQTAAGLPADGRVGPNTWRVLLRVTRRGHLGRINPVAGPLGPVAYALERNGPRAVAMHLLPEQETKAGVRNRPILFEAKMSIDADGDGDAWRSDPWGQPETSLQHPGGKSLNPTEIPYFVLPIGFDAKHPGMKLGDVCAVIYEDKLAYAIYGDRGPRGRVGEGSIKLARELGINASPTHGGVSAGVFYIVFPGSGDRRPLPVEEIRRRGEENLIRAGGQPEPPRARPFGRRP